MSHHVWASGVGCQCALNWLDIGGGKLAEKSADIQIDGPLPEAVISGR